MQLLKITHVTRLDRAVRLQYHNDECGVLQNTYKLAQQCNFEEFDSFFGTISPKMRAQESPKGILQSLQEKVAASDSEVDPPAVPLNRNSFGMNKSEIVVQMNKLVVEDDKIGQNIENAAEKEEQDPFGSSPQSDQLPDDQEIDGLFGPIENNDTQIVTPKNNYKPIISLESQHNGENDNDDNEDFNERLDECQVTIEQPKQQQRKSILKDTNDLESAPAFNVFENHHRSLSKSVYVSNKTIDILEDNDYQEEYLDNQFWKIDDQPKHYNIDDLFEDMMEQKEDEPATAVQEQS